ncbi:MAG: signal recognition particle-docking protein FtsY [Cyanobacteria bacterium P01_F01_bin.150]
MPFNWFKRQFGDKKKDEASQQESPSPKESQEKVDSASDEPDSQSSQESAADSASTVDTTPDNANDYLQWAKAAYQNIQKQRKAAEVTDPAEADAAESDSEASTTAEQDDREENQQREPSETTVESDDSQSSSEVASEKIGESASRQASGKIAGNISGNLFGNLTGKTTGEVDAPASEASEASSLPQEEPSQSEIGTDEDSEDSTVSDEVAATPAVTATDNDDTPSVEPLEASEESTANVTEVTSGAERSGLEDTPTNEPADTGTGAIDSDMKTDADQEVTTAALPFWAKAEAERQERLERLKETAIEESEEPEVQLDEDFVWSAGVLASQGRKADEVSMEEITWLTKLRQGLGKTRRGLMNELKAVVGQGPLNADAVMEIESLLLQADVGIDATDYVIESLQARMKEGALPPEEAIAYLKEILRGILDKPFESEYTEEFVPEKDCLNIWLLTGVNGAGKTTTIGKLAHMTRTSDYRCLIAAADTFRAAAVEQVKVWGERSGVDVIANPGQNTDPAAVVFDAISAAQARDVELLLVDTAGRLQNKKNLMAELSKIRRIVDKKASSAKVESLLVLDATLGQNGLRQAQVFSEAAKLSGVVLTKLDGSAKGGVALAVVQQLGLPIRFVGAGEGIEDLRPFSSYEFVEALLSA